jgi:hypothetical protein
MKSNPNKDFVESDDGFERRSKIHSGIFAALGLVASILIGLLGNILSEPAKSILDSDSLLIIFALLVLPLLLISFLVSVLSGRSKPVNRLKNQLTNSFLRVIDKSSFNPRLKEKYK